MAPADPISRVDVIRLLYIVAFSLFIYGMAVAQAQYAVRELTKLVEQKGIEVSSRPTPSPGACPAT